MSGAVVGSVAVEVVPSVQSFPEKLRRDLLPAADRIGREVGKAISDQIQAAMGTPRIRVDTSQAKVNVDELNRRVSSIGQGAGARIKVDTTEADAKIAGIKAKLADIANAKLAVAVDTAAADAKLIALNAEARKLREDIKGGSVDLDVDAAKARLAEISTEIGGIRDAKAQVKVDTAEANVRVAALRDELDQATRDRRVKVDVDTAAARAEIAALKADASDAESSGGGGGGGGGFGLGLGMSLLPALIPIAAAAVPVIGGIGAALVGAAAGGGVLKAAFSGIGDAVTALGAKSAQTGQQLKQQAAQQLSAQLSILNAQDAVAASLRGLANARTQATQQAVSSAEAVRNAEQAETDARRSAAASIRNAEQGVTTAEQSYTSALYAEHQAQTALNQARSQARQTLQDLANQVKDGSLSQRQATIDLQNALDNLKVVDFNPHSTSQQRAEAQLQVDEAKQHLSELELGNARLAAQKALADKQGIANAPAVVSAEHAMADATRTRETAARGVAQAQAAVVEAQRAGAESVAKAEQGVSDALRSQAQQAASSQQAILSAEQSVVSSQRSLAQAYASAAAQGTAANQAVAASMAALTPAGRRFAQFINDVLKPAWKGVTDAAQAGFLPGFQKALTILLPFLPGFAKFVGDIARELGNMAQSAAKALTGPFWRQFGTFLEGLAKSSLPVLGQILGNLATGFAGLFEAIAPAGNGVGGGLVAISKAFADWATHLGTNKGFQAFMQYVKDNSPAVGKFFRDLLEVGGKLIVALAPLGALLLAAFEKLAGFLAKLSPDQLLAIGVGIAVAVALLTGSFGAIAVAVAGVIAGLVELYRHNPTFKKFIDELVAKIREGVQFIKDHWHGMVTSLVQAYDEHLKPMLETWMKILTSMWTTVVRPILGFIIAHWRFFALVVEVMIAEMLLQFKILTTAVNFLWFYVFKPVIDFIVSHWHYLATAFKAIYDDVLQPVFGYISKNWANTGNNFKSVYDHLISPIWTTMETAFHATGGAFGKFRDGLSAVWGDIRRIFTAGVNDITQNVLNKFLGAINKVTHLFGIAPIPAIPRLGGKSAGPALGGGATGGNNSGNSENLALAHGGVLPGYAPGVDSIHAVLSPGEGVLVPEAVRGLGPNFVHAVNRHFSNRHPSSDNHHFFGGGIVKAIKSGFGAVGGAAEWALGSAAEIPLSIAERVAHSLLKHLSPQVVQTLGTTAFDLVDKGLRSLIGRSSSAASSGGPISGNHLALIAQALGLAKVPVTAGNEAAVNLIVTHESGWNPNAINLTDINAQQGHPSQGLMQTIPSTFNAYALHGLGGITDPVANLVAGIRYAVSTYGSLGDVPGVRAVNAGGSYVGYDNGGYLQPGITQVYNGTGRPEPVLTDDHWQAIKAMASSNRQQGSGKIAETVNLHQVTDVDGLLMELARRQQMMAGT